MEAEFRALVLAAEARPRGLLHFGVGHRCATRQQRAIADIARIAAETQAERDEIINAAKCSARSAK